jgi:hypothetical protein
MALEVLADLGQDLCIDETRHGVAHHALVVMEFIFDARDIVWGKCQVLLLLRDPLSRRPAVL